MADINIDEYVTPGWFEHANCKGIDTEIFFPLFNGSSTMDSRMNKKRALAYCASCIVRENCLFRGMYSPSDTGIMGGSTFVQRSRERRLIREGKPREITAHWKE